MKNRNYVREAEVDQLLPTRNTRRAIVIATLIFMWVMIAYLTLFGDPLNSLHQSGLSWSFMTMLAVIFAYVFGAVVDNWNLWKTMNAPSPIIMRDKKESVD